MNCFSFQCSSKRQVILSHSHHIFVQRWRWWRKSIYNCSEMLSTLLFARFRTKRGFFCILFSKVTKPWCRHPMKIFAILRGNSELWNLCKSLKCIMNKLQKLYLNKVRLKICKKILLLTTEQKSIQAFFIYSLQMHNPYDR